MPSSTSTPQPLSIAVLGVGAIGSTFAYYLARAGHSVTTVARPGSVRLQQLQRDGGIVLTTGERAATQVADALDEQAAFDLILVTTLAHQAEALVPALQRSRAKAVQPMLNTLHAEALRDAIGASRCTLGMPFVMAMLDRDGKLQATVSSSRKTLHGDRRWADLFTSAGLPSAFEARMPLWLRCHVPLCVGFEGIAFRAAQQNRGATWPQAMLVAKGVRGAFTIVKGMGTPLYPAAKRVLNGAPAAVLAAMFWGLTRNRNFRDLLATGVHECRALIDDLLEAARSTSATSAAVAAVAAIRPV